MQTKVLWFAAILQLLIELRVSSQEPGEICGKRIFTEPTGVINFTAPRFTSSRNSTCNYQVSVGEENLVSLKFLYFDLPTFLDFCNSNWMTISCITDEISKTLTRKSPLLCEQTKWSAALKLSECPVLSVEVVFSSDLEIDRKGFQLKYDISSTVRGNASDENDIQDIECGDTVFTNQSGTIVLPNNPSIPRAKLNCTYTISTNEPDTLISLLTLDVSYIDLLTLTDEIDGCEQEHLKIRCTGEDEQASVSSGCEIFSSDSLSSPVYRGCLTLEITLQSDSYDPRETRLINYDMTVESTDEDDNTFDHGGNAVCGNSTYRGQTGNVSSPRFPLAHPDNLNCTYRIAVGKQNALSLKFVAFNLEGSSGSCNVDWINIACVVNSPPNFSTAGRLCGRKETPLTLRYWNCSSVYLQFRTDASVSWGGFKIQYSVERKDSFNMTEMKCGQTEFNTSDGVIALPSNPSGYVSQINCTYRVLANGTSNFHLNVSSLNLTKIGLQLGGCIQFLCEGENTMSARLCDRHNYYNYEGSGKLLLYNCQNLTISLVSNFFELQESYKVPFTVIPSDTICGERSLSESKGSISFPYIYRSYHPNTKCNYTIAGGNNRTISIAFDRSQYQYPDYRYCHDKITILCLNSSKWNPYSGWRYCSQLRWPSVMHFFNCSALLIAFSSGYYTNTAGFRLNYTVYNGEIKDSAEDFPKIPCGSSYSTLSGRIGLPAQIGVLLASINCVYNISLKFFSKGSISFDFAPLSNAFGYSIDYRAVNLTILCSSDDSSAEINGTRSLTFGGRGLPRAITEFSIFRCDSIVLSIQSSAYYPGEYRYMLFKIKNTECGNVSHDGSTGNIMSPLFPLPYEMGLNCSYYIEVGDENFITLQSLTFSLPGTSRDTPVIPSYYSHYHNADSRFGEERSLSVYRHDICYSDQLTIRCLFNGSQITSNNKYLNRALCGNRTAKIEIFGCQALRLEFITGDSGYRRMPGFNIHYQIQDANNSDVHCGNSFVGPSGIITSPGYPDHYPNGINCTYVIKAGGNTSAMIEVSFFDLQPATHRYIHERTLHDYECHLDWLEVRCSSEEPTLVNQLKNRRFCGHQRPFTMLLRGCEQVFIYFSTDSTVAFNGFKIQYKIYSEGEECGNTVFTNSTGFITSPGYPGPYPHRINCTYYIEVGSNNSLSLRLLSFDVGYAQGYYHNYQWATRCISDWFRITCSSRDSREAPFTSQYLNKQFCGSSHSFSAKFKRCNQYALEFSSGGNYSKPGFRLHYTIIKPEEECGRREFSNSTDIITSPGYPSNYEPNLNCIYHIDIGNNLLFLHFHYIGIETSYYHYHNYNYPCSSDWLQITCVSRRANASLVTNENINRKLCGQRFNFSATLDGCSRAAIQFVSGESFLRSGFKLQYNIIKTGYCGYSSNNFTDAEGTIVAPYLLMGRQLPTSSCKYLISAQQMSTISLTIAVIPTSTICFGNWLSIKCLDEGNLLNYSSKLCKAMYLSEKVVLPSCSSVQLLYPSTNYLMPFVINYRVAGPEEVCGKSVFTEPTGYITFPKFSPKYITKFNCSYSVFVGTYNSISFELSSFVDTDGNNETFPNDWISIFCHGNNDNGKNRITHNDSVQSKERMTLSFTNCSTVDVVFHSENQATKRRFNVSYTIRSNYTTKECSPASSSAMTTSSTATTTSSPVTTTSSLAKTISSSAPKFNCPKECIVYLNNTVFECPTNPPDQTTAEPSVQISQATRFVKTGSFGVLIAFIVLLILASLAVLTVVWLRRRGTKPKEDENTLTVEDSESENPDSQEKRRQGFNPWSFIPFRSRIRGNQGRQKGFVPLEPMGSSLSRAYSEQNIQSNPTGVSSDKIAILE